MTRPLPSFPESLRATYPMRTTDTMEGSARERAAAQDLSPAVRVPVHPVFRRRDWVLFAVLTAVSSAAIVLFLVSWFSPANRSGAPVAFAALTAILLVKLTINQFRWWLLPRMKRPGSLSGAPGQQVAVVTTFVAAAESPQMLESTVRALVALDYPHDTWVLDEGDDPAIRELCRRQGARHFSRRKLEHCQQPYGRFQSGSKHGNYNAWLHEIGFAQYDFIAAFDPDHVPSPDFLSAVLGYFDDPSIGYVQVAQAYYNQDASFIARGAAEETYGYFSVTQMAAYSMGYPVLVGCHNTHRMAALREVGGVAAHDADDLLLTLLYQTAGWRGVYVPKILARGLTPVDWKGYLRQQLRWARSVLDIKLRLYPRLAARLPVRERVLSFLHGLGYVEEALMIPFAITVVALMLVTGSIPPVVRLETALQLAGLWVVLQLCDVFRQTFYLDPSRERGLHWRAALLKLAKWPYFLRALIEAVLQRREPYVVTPKIRQAVPRRMLWPHLVTALILGAAWVAGLLLHRRIDPVLHGTVALLITASLVLTVMERRNSVGSYDHVAPCA